MAKSNSILGKLKIGQRKRKVEAEDRKEKAKVGRYLR